MVLCFPIQRKQTFLKLEVNKIMRRMFSEKQIEGMIEEQIEHEKDILSQIEIVEDSAHQVTYIIFPKYVLPIKWYDTTLETYVYLDYEQGVLRDESGELVNNSYVTTEQQKVQIEIPTTGYSVEEIYDLVYLFQYLNDDISSLCNWHAILNPKGTQLYEHKLSGSASTYDSETIEFSNFIIYSTSNTKITTTTLLNDTIASSVGIAPKYGTLICEGDIALLVYYSISIGLVAYDLDSSPVTLMTYAPLQDMGTIVDTVTPL